jgi:hypothetical protein
MKAKSLVVFLPLVVFALVIAFDPNIWRSYGRVSQSDIDFIAEIKAIEARHQASKSTLSDLERIAQLERDVALLKLELAKKADK